MTRYLAYTSPARGHLYPLVQTLLELRDRGHDVHVRTLSSEVATLDRLGLHAAPVDPAIEQLTLRDWEASSAEEGLAGVFQTFRDRTEHEVPDLQSAVADVDPDVLLVDVASAGAAAVAEASTLPWAQWSPFFQHDTRVPDATLVPFTFAPIGMEALNAPRERIGLQPVDPADAWRAPLYLYFTATPFEVEGLDLPASFRYVGPGLWEPPSPAPGWLEDLDKPLVLVTASSEFQRDDALITATLEALRDDDVHVVVSTAAHDPGTFAVPANARVERWLPHGPVLRKAACVVCHGGMGITQRALAAGVPVCVVPVGRDQFEVAARVSANQAGVQVLGDPTSEALGAAIRTTMTMREGAQRVAAGFADAGGAPAAADALEGLTQPQATSLVSSAGGPR